MVASPPRALPGATMRSPQEPSLVAHLVGPCAIPVDSPARLTVRQQLLAGLPALPAAASAPPAESVLQALRAAVGGCDSWLLSSESGFAPRSFLAVLPVFSAHSVACLNCSGCASAGRTSGRGRPARPGSVFACRSASRLRHDRMTVLRGPRLRSPFVSIRTTAGPNLVFRASFLPITALCSLLFAFRGVIDDGKDGCTLTVYACGVRLMLRPSTLIVVLKRRPAIAEQDDKKDGWTLTVHAYGVRLMLRPLDPNRRT
jgi:hypothetical protein